MPDIGIATIEKCMAALEELPYEDAIAAMDYIHRRLSIRENRRRIVEAQKAKLGRDPTEAEEAQAMDEWNEDPDREIAGAGTGPMAATARPPYPPSMPGYTASGAIPTRTLT